MRCEYSMSFPYTRNCPSIDKTATLKFIIEQLDQTMFTCAACANILEAELQREGLPYAKVSLVQVDSTISDYRDSSVDDSDDDGEWHDSDDISEPEPPEVNPC